MKFFIEQIAICPHDPEAARRLLEDMEAVKWIHDDVDAVGEVFGVATQTSAELEFNYQMGPPDVPLEFEILHYPKGNRNWMERRGPSVSHLGMHCTASDLARWREFFAARRIQVVQELETQRHTNKVIRGKRQYTYVIFGTRDILGVDLKFIVRHNIDEMPPYTKNPPECFGA